eukprot:gene30921-35976_t
MSNTPISSKPSTARPPPVSSFNASSKLPVIIPLGCERWFRVNSVVQTEDTRKRTFESHAQGASAILGQRVVKSASSSIHAGARYSSLWADSNLPSFSPALAVSRTSKNTLASASEASNSNYAASGNDDLPESRNSPGGNDEGDLAVMPAHSRVMDTAHAASSGEASDSNSACVSSLSVPSTQPFRSDGYQAAAALGLGWELEQPQHGQALHGSGVSGQPSPTGSGGSGAPQASQTYHPMQSVQQANTSMRMWLDCNANNPPHSSRFTSLPPPKVDPKQGSSGTNPWHASTTSTDSTPQKTSTTHPRTLSSEPPSPAWLKVKDQLSPTGSADAASRVNAKLTAGDLTTGRYSEHPHSSLSSAPAPTLFLQLWVGSNWEGVSRLQALPAGPIQNVLLLPTQLHTSQPLPTPVPLKEMQVQSVSQLAPTPVPAKEAEVQSVPEPLPTPAPVKEAEVQSSQPAPTSVPARKKKPQLRTSFQDLLLVPTQPPISQPLPTPVHVRVAEVQSVSQPLPTPAPAKETEVQSSQPAPTSVLARQEKPQLGPAVPKPGYWIRESPQSYHLIPLSWITNHIKQTTSLAKLAAMLAVHSSRLDEIHLTAALDQFADLSRSAGRKITDPSDEGDLSSQEQQELVSNLLDRLLPLVPELKPKGVRVTLWALATLNVYHKEVICALMDHTEDTLEKFSHNEVAMSLWALTKLQVNGRQELLMSLSELIAGYNWMDGIAAKDFAQILWCFSRYPATLSSAALSALVSKFESMGMEMFTCNDVARSLYCFAMLSPNPIKGLASKTLYFVLQPTRQHGAMVPQNYCQVAYALARWRMGAHQITAKPGTDSTSPPSNRIKRHLRPSGRMKFQKALRHDGSKRTTLKRLTPTERNHRQVQYRQALRVGYTYAALEYTSKPKPIVERVAPALMAGFEHALVQFVQRGSKWQQYPAANHGQHSEEPNQRQRSFTARELISLLSDFADMRHAALRDTVLILMWELSDKLLYCSLNDIMYLTDILVHLGESPSVIITCASDLSVIAGMASGVIITCATDLSVIAGMASGVIISTAAMLSPGLWATGTMLSWAVGHCTMLSWAVGHWYPQPTERWTNSQLEPRLFKTRSRAQSQWQDSLLDQASYSKSYPHSGNQPSNLLVVRAFFACGKMGSAMNCQQYSSSMVSLPWHAKAKRVDCFWFLATGSSYLSTRLLPLSGINAGELAWALGELRFPAWDILAVLRPSAVYIIWAIARLGRPDLRLQREVWHSIRKAPQSLRSQHIALLLWTLVGTSSALSSLPNLNVTALPGAGPALPDVGEGRDAAKRAGANSASPGVSGAAAKPAGTSTASAGGGGGAAKPVGANTVSAGGPVTSRPLPSLLTRSALALAKLSAYRAEAGNTSTSTHTTTAATATYPQATTASTTATSTNSISPAAPQHSNQASLSASPASQRSSGVLSTTPDESMAEMPPPPKGVIGFMATQAALAIHKYRTKHVLMVLWSLAVANFRNDAFLEASRDWVLFNMKHAIKDPDEASRNWVMYNMQHAIKDRDEILYNMQHAMKDPDEVRQLLWCYQRLNFSAEGGLVDLLDHLRLLEANQAASKASRGSGQTRGALPYSAEGRVHYRGSRGSGQHRGASPYSAEGQAHDRGHRGSGETRGASPYSAEGHMHKRG